MATAGLGWQEGPYDGAMLTGHEVFTAGKSDGFKLVFDLNGHRIESTYWLTEKAFARSVQDLVSIFGFNSDFENPQFSKPGPHRLELTIEEYPPGSGKKQARWRPPYVAAPVDQSKLQRFRAMAQSIPLSGPPPVPAAPPPPAKPVAPPAATNSAPPPPAPAKEPPKSPEPRTRQQCWDAFCQLHGASAATEWANAVRKRAAEIGRDEAGFTDADFGAMFPVPW